ncbi:DUF2844 domain-containing protein [Paraburkholderia acidipaludis]|uniref:DUF2844 domain-containing protein n=1 Tax=Paraburkholderia acidipaludis TaxID=660537 RepID=UPI0004807524|nr:DUF2844 domain-containing protein [Paraburkholderia acidipaludis]
MAAFGSNASYDVARAAGARLAALTLTGAIALVCAQPAMAGLGSAPMTTPAGATVSTLGNAAAQAGSAGTSAAARQAVEASATGSSAAAASYTVRQTTLANGTVVREYVSQAGSVFGVAWNGPQMPNLSELLGSYFPQYVAGVKANRAAGFMHGPGVVEQSGLVVHSGGHMGSFSGQAWLPGSLPSGVGASDIQ